MSETTRSGNGKELTSNQGDTGAESRHFDAIVIGTGQSGPSMAARLDQEGLRTAVIEKHLFGGSCVNVGCIPTKTLVASARAAQMARRAGDYGVVLQGEVQVDMKAVKARKDQIVAQSNKGVEGWMHGLKHGEVIVGHARFLSPQAVEVNGQTLTAERFFINVGARAFNPPIEGLNDVPYLDNVSMMDLDEVPGHLVVVGGSYIGLEFGQMYRRFGSKVTILEKGDRLIPRDDADISAAVREILENEGVEVRLNADCMKIEKHGDGVAVRVNCEDGAQMVEGTHLLMAVGRRPNTDDLGLEKAGVETDERGFIKVNDTLQTTAPHIWAMGDVNGLGAFTHTSYNDYEIVAANLFANDNRKASDRLLCYGLFIDPPLGRVGMTEEQVRNSGRKALIGKRMMTRVGRAKEMGETQGFIKILVDAESKRILGAAILGLNGDEVVHSLLDIMYADAPYTVIQRAVHIHPTVSELIPTVLGDLKPLE